MRISANANLLSKSKDYYSLENTTINRSFLSAEKLDTIKKVALGALVTAIELPALGAIYQGIIDLMSKLDLSCIATDQDAFQLWSSFDHLPYQFIGQAFKAALLGYIVIGAPLIEEWLFRENLQTFMKEWVSDPETTYNTMIRVFGNGFIFGAAHLSPFQGWANIPIFFITFLMGCIYASLREATGDLTASTTAHMLHNGAAMCQFLLS
jgi:membrane protease YdiL (CAAX protease family)